MTIMMKVLIADDENHILNHLKTAVPWAQLGLQVCACAHNGQEALDYITDHPVDILITDIRMPGMDGLELCRQVRRFSSDLAIILLTGYSDFEYARQAIELQVLDYCLKPIDVTQLSQILVRAVRKGYSKASTRADALLDRIEEGDTPSVAQIFSDLGLKGNRIYLAGSVGVHNIEKDLGAALSYKVGKHKYLYFSDHPLNRSAAAKIIAFAKGRSGIGLPDAPFPLAHLAGAVDDVLVMTLQYFINGSPTLCTQLVEESLSEDLFRQFDAYKSSPERMKTWLHELSLANCSTILNIRTAFRLLNHIAMCPALQNNGDEEAYLYGFEQLASEYLHLSDILEEFSRSLRVSAPAQPSSGTGSFLKILSYLNEHYASDISLKKISEEFHLNSSYISQLIKSETGLTYTQYVTELRINKAKELLKTTKMSLNEVSEAVGFNDYFYFIKKFKREVGITPGKYSS